MSNRRRVLRAITIAAPVVLVIGIVVAAVLVGRTAADNRVVVRPTDAPAATSPQCATILAALPDKLDDRPAAEIAAPVPPATRAWRHDDGDPIVLRCGVAQPREFTAASSLQLVDGVQWFESAASWYTVDRAVTISLTLPTGTGPTAIQTVSDIIAHAVPAQPPVPAPLPN